MPPTFLQASTLCQPHQWPGEIAALYGSKLTDILNDLTPFWKVSRRPQSSDPWFDNDCFEAKLLTRRLRVSIPRPVGNSLLVPTPVCQWTPTLLRWPGMLKAAIIVIFVGPSAARSDVTPSILIETIWCACKRLQLNADKTDVLWFGSSSHLH